MKTQQAAQGSSQATRQSVMKFLVSIVFRLCEPPAATEAAIWNLYGLFSNQHTMESFIPLRKFWSLHVQEFVHIIRRYYRIADKFLKSFSELLKYIRYNVRRKHIDNGIIVCHTTSVMIQVGWQSTEWRRESFFSVTPMTRTMEDRLEGGNENRYKK